MITKGLVLGKSMISKGMSISWIDRILVILGRINTALQVEGWFK